MSELKELSLTEKLQHVQSHLNAPKDLFNKFGNYSYRSAESILQAVKPLLQETGTTIVVDDEVVLIGDRYYVKATAVFTDGVTTDKASAFAREEDIVKGMASAQITGSTSSYARKYALNGLLLIDDNKDPDSKDPENKPASKRNDRPAAPVRPQEQAPKQTLKPITPKTEKAPEPTQAEPEGDSSAPEVDRELEERKAKALSAFEVLDASKVLAHLIQNEKIIKYVKLADFVAGEDIDTVVRIYSAVKKTCAKTADAPKPDKKSK